MRKANFTYFAGQNQIFWETDAKYTIVPKGRRYGLTRGAANCFIEQLLNGVSPLLWGDVIYTNIDKYVERYFKPQLSAIGLRPDEYTWNKSEKILKIGDSFCDFRSAEYPESWEGFGYKVIFLNEAGIILKDRYLWDNAVGPMLLDFPDSRLIAGGTPKGKRAKESAALFHELWERCENGHENYKGYRFTTYDNPLLKEEDINDLIQDMPSSVVRQEIYGEFIDLEGAMIKREWLRYKQPPDTQPVIGVDLAISSKETADYTTISVLNKDSEGNIYVVDIYRERLNFYNILKAIERFAEKYDPEIIGIEQVSFQQSVVQELLRTTDLNIKGVDITKDKVTRFQPVAARYEQGLIYHNRNLPQYFENELLSFPESEHDDLIDSLSLAYHLLNRGGVKFWVL